MSNEGRGLTTQASLPYLESPTFVDAMWIDPPAVPDAFPGQFPQSSSVFYPAPAQLTPDVYGPSLESLYGNPSADAQAGPVHLNPPSGSPNGTQVPSHATAPMDHYMVRLQEADISRSGPHPYQQAAVAPRVLATPHSQPPNLSIVDAPAVVPSSSHPTAPQTPLARPNQLKRKAAGRKAAYPPLPSYSQVHDPSVTAALQSTHGPLPKAQTQQTTGRSYYRAQANYDNPQNFSTPNTPMYYGQRPLNRKVGTRALPSNARANPAPGTIFVYTTRAIMKIIFCWILLEIHGVGEVYFVRGEGGKIQAFASPKSLDELVRWFTDRYSMARIVVRKCWEDFAVANLVELPPTEDAPAASSEMVLDVDLGSGDEVLTPISQYSTPEWFIKTDRVALGSVAEEPNAATAIPESSHTMVAEASSSTDQRESIMDATDPNSASGSQDELDLLAFSSSRYYYPPEIIERLFSHRQGLGYRTTSLDEGVNMSDAVGHIPAGGATEAADSSGSDVDFSEWIIGYESE